jgi:uncharacterized protein YjbI with pentapeptide repeats
VKPSDEPQLQLPLYSPDGYTIQLSNGDYVLLIPGGNYNGLIFSEIDFTSITIKADFSGVTFSHCYFDKTDLSGSTLSSAHFDDCLMSESALMWCELSDVAFTRTSVEDTRFAFSNLSCAQFGVATTLRECNFRDTNLSGANLKNAVLVDCEFMSTVAPDVTIRDCRLYRLNIKKSNFLGLHVEDSAVEAIAIMDSNMSGSSWSSVTSESGHWIVSRADFTASTWSLVDVKDSSWNKATFFGVFMERCNWFQNRLTKCEFEESTMNSVGWNETKFNEVHFINLKASALRLRFADFYCCFLKNCVIKDSAFEYCQLWASGSDNFEIVRPTYSQETKWHAGYIPDTLPHPTDHPKNN